MTADTRTKNRRGNYSMMMGFAVLGILGFGALGVDISYIAMANTQAQAVADAASHAALIAYRNSGGGTEAAKQADGNAAANWIVDNNDVGINGIGDLTSLQYGQFNSAAGTFNTSASPYNAVRARVERPSTDALDLILAPMIGVTEAQVQQQGITVANPREIVLVIDRSGSMAGAGEVGTGNAIEAFAQHMVSTQLPLDRIGAVWFSDGANDWRPFNFIAGSESTILANWTSAAWQAWCCTNTTNQGAGILRARNMLNSSGNDLAFKAIIVISDGAPCCNGSVERDFFIAQANAAWADDIHVWTVAFGGGVNATTRALMFSTSKGLGKPANQAQWDSLYFAPSAAGVQAIVQRIAESIPVAMVE